MENMENNAVTMENTGAADVATNATIGQKLLTNAVRGLVVVGMATIIKGVVKGTKILIGKVNAKKAAKQTQEVIEVEPISEDETK
jgi:hypothetical protein